MVKKRDLNFCPKNDSDPHNWALIYFEEMYFNIQ